MGNNPSIFRTKALAIRAMVNGQLLGSQFPFARCPSRRELEIQIAKLERMLDAFIRKFGPEAAATKTSAARKAFRRKIGPEVARQDKQVKKMQELFYKTLEESYFQVPRTETRKQFRQALVAVSRTFEKMIYTAQQEFQKQLFPASGQKHLKS